VKSSLGENVNIKITWTTREDKLCHQHKGERLVNWALLHNEK